MAPSSVPQPTGPALALAAHQLTGLPLAVWSGVRFDDTHQEHWNEPGQAIVVDQHQQRWFDEHGWHEGLTPTEGLRFGGIVFDIVLEAATAQQVATIFSPEPVTAAEVDAAKAFVLSNGLLDISTPSPPAKRRGPNPFKNR